MLVSCILSKFYIKPQRAALNVSAGIGCILSKFYIKPQLRRQPLQRSMGCILSKFYIKPQPNILKMFCATVVSYRNSTSNHNYIAIKGSEDELYLIEILHQTTTSTSSAVITSSLYLIEILHQTTTHRRPNRPTSELYLIEILHQTTTSGLILIDKVLLTGCLPL